MAAIEVGKQIYIPHKCPETVRTYGEITNSEKRKLLGSMAYVRGIVGSKVLVTVKETSISRWFFHIDDLANNNDETSQINIPTQTFDPENLTV